MGIYTQPQWESPETELTTVVAEEMRIIREAFVGVSGDLLSFFLRLRMSTLVRRTKLRGLRFWSDTLQSLH